MTQGNEFIGDESKPGFCGVPGCNCTGDGVPRPAFVGGRFEVTSTSMYEMVREFHRVFRHPVNQFPTLLPVKRGEAARNWIVEENNEFFFKGVVQEDLIETIDGLGDLLYFVLGRFVECGVDPYPIFREIHRSNMTKLGPDGEPLFNAEGKTMKGPNYEPPDIRGELIKQGWVPA